MGIILFGWTFSANDTFLVILSKFFECHSENILSMASLICSELSGEAIIPPPFLKRSATTPSFGLSDKIGREVCK